MTTITASLALTDLLPGQAVRITVNDSRGDVDREYVGTVISALGPDAVEFRSGVQVFDIAYRSATETGWYSLDHDVVIATGQPSKVHIGLAHDLTCACSDCHDYS